MERNKDVLLEMPPDTELSELTNFNVICRLCASQQNRLLGIYSHDGVNNDLAIKINLYLPIKVHETDELPLHCCLQCASAILAWHNLVVTTVETDRRLRSSHFIASKELEQVSTTFEPSKQENVPSGNSLNAFCQTENLEITAEKELSSPYSDNLNELVCLEPRYSSSNNDIYDIKSEMKLGKMDFEVPRKIELDNIFEDENETLHKKDVDSTVYGCQSCQMVFLNQESMATHFSELHPSDKTKLDSNIDKTTTKKRKRKNTKIDQKLVKAARIIVDDKVYYNCKECGRCLYSPYTYLCHMRIHTGERPHKCNQCGKQFRVSQGLVRHLKETHQGIKNFACDLCRRMFATRRNVEEHRRIHTNERPYVCDLCGKSFKQKASLFVHNRSHSDSFPFKCSYCNQAFRTKAPLLIHITKHTGEKPYPCDICGRHFRIKYELKRHRLIHSDEKPFSCEVCGLSFKQKRYLRNHNKLNHNNANG